MPTLDKLAFALLALATSSAVLPARTQAAPPAVTCWAGTAVGGLSLPATSDIGRMDGRLVTATGLMMDLHGLLEPTVTGPWTGFSPTGVVYGTVTSGTSGAALVGVQFFGSYATDTDGRGTLTASLSMPNPVFGLPSLVIGTLSGQFRDAAELNPLTLLPIPGDFLGSWGVCF